MPKTPDSGATDRGGWDVHMHLVPQAVIRAAEAGRFGMAVAPDMLHVCGHGVPLLRIGDRAKLVERLDCDQLDGGLISLPPPLFRPDLPASHRAEYAVMVNEAMLEACSRHLTGLRPLAYLPMEDPELALETAQALGPEWAGVVIGTDANGLSYADSLYAPLWEHLAAERLPMFVHPSTPRDPRLEQFYLSNLIGNPIETTIIAAQLIFGGVLHRHPSLKVILAHGGGCVAALCGRMQRGKETSRPGIPATAPNPAEAIRRFYVDSVVHSPPYLLLLIEILGADQVLLGSDWPFPMGAPNADHDLCALDPALRFRLRKVNPEKVYERLIIKPR